jgi:hypothetical protein
MHIVSYLPPYSSLNQINEPLLHSPLLALLDQTDRPTTEELIDAIEKEIELSRAYLNIGAFPFPILLNRCSRLPPEEGLLLLLQYFVPLSKFAENSQLIDYQHQLSSSISDLTIFFGRRTLARGTSFLEVRATALQIRDLLNCGTARRITQNQLQDSTESLYSIAYAASTSKLYQESVIHVCKQLRLDPFQSLELTRSTSKLYLIDDRDIEEVRQAVISLAVQFSCDGIEFCQTAEQFENLAHSVNTLLDSWADSRNRTLQLLNHSGDTQRTTLLRFIITGYRKEQFLEALVMHFPDNFFSQANWDMLGVCCQVVFKECSIKLWLAVGANGSRFDTVLAAANRLSISQTEDLVATDERCKERLGRLISKIPLIREEAVSLRARFSHLFNGFLLDPVKNQDLPPLPLSPLLKLLDQTSSVSESDLSHAVDCEIQTCRTYVQQKRFPFPALLLKCASFPTDQKLIVCTEFFSALTRHMSPASMEYQISSEAIATVAIHFCDVGLNQQTDCLEIWNIARRVQFLLNLSQGKAAAFEQLKNQTLSPASQLVFEIASDGNGRSLHRHVLFCAARLRKLNSVQALSLSRHYLRSMTPSQNSGQLQTLAAELAVEIGISGVQSCRSLIEFESLAIEIHLLFDSFSSNSRGTALRLVDQYTPSNNRIQLLRSLIAGTRNANFIELIALHVTDSFFTRAEWDEMGQRCQVLDIHSPIKLWIAAAANGLGERFARETARWFTSQGEQLSEIVDDSKSREWLMKLYRRTNHPIPAWLLSNSI